VPLQLFYYDRELRRSHRLGDVVFIAATIFLAGAYCAAALAHGA
jgi:hypothetical protein